MGGSRCVNVPGALSLRSGSNSERGGGDVRRWGRKDRAKRGRLSDYSPDWNFQCLINEIIWVS